LSFETIQNPKDRGLSFETVRQKETKLAIAHDFLEHRAFGFWIVKVSVTCLMTREPWELETM